MPAAATLLLALACVTLADGKNILFLMSDSMDGRVLDPTSPVHAFLDMPHLRSLATSGTNFIRTYAASPQCVPSRTSMFAGRHTHHIKAWSNGQGLAAAPTTGALDSICVSRYSKETCSDWAKEQDVKATLLDALREAGASGKYGGPRAIRK